MGSVLHGCARTTPRGAPSVAREQPDSCRPVRPEPENGGQVAQAGHDVRRAYGAEGPESTVLTPVVEAIVVAFREKTLLPLDDVLGCLKDTIPNLSRSTLLRRLRPNLRSIARQA